MIDHIDDFLIEEKKKIFVTTVLMVCDKRDIPIPQFNFDGCESETDNSLAHYHPDIHLICCSKIQLSKMTFEDIERTAAHEITHYLNQDHSPQFVENENLSNIAAFDPKGVVHVKKSIKLSPNRKERPDKTKCNYHLCRKKRRTYQCSYCKKYFCDEHVKPAKVGIADKTATNWENLELLNSEGHPCPDYVDAAEKEAKQQDKKYQQWLSNTLDKSKKGFQFGLVDEPAKTGVGSKKYPPKQKESRMPPKVQEKYTKEYVSDKMGKTKVKVHTGGTREFVYDANERLEDTDSTNAFKEELRHWQKNPTKYWLKHNYKKVIVGIIVLIIILILFRWWGSLT